MGETLLIYCAEVERYASHAENTEITQTAGLESRIRWRYGQVLSRSRQMRWDELIACGRCWLSSAGSGGGLEVRALSLSLPPWPALLNSSRLDQALHYLKQYNSSGPNPISYPTDLKSPPFNIELGYIVWYCTENNRDNWNILGISLGFRIHKLINKSFSNYNSIKNKLTQL